MSWLEQLTRNSRPSQNVYRCVEDREAQLLGKRRDDGLHIGHVEYVGALRFVSTFTPEKSFQDYFLDLHSVLSREVPLAHILAEGTTMA